jgi:hypothetical protein
MEASWDETAWETYIYIYGRIILKIDVFVFYLCIALRFYHWMNVA